jgi:urease accessory protein
MIMPTIMPTITAITTPSMADEAEFQRLAWFSPAFPVGGYAYSHGIEKAVETGDVADPASLTAWIADIVRLGSGRNDAILLAEAWRQTGALTGEARLVALRSLAELGMALGLSRERRLETSQQGAAFQALITSAWPHPDLPILDDTALPYSVAVGVAGRVHGQPVLPLASAFLQAFAANLIAAGIRLGIIGQSHAQARLAELGPVIRQVAMAARNASLDDLGGMTFRADLMSLRHETQEARLFRS